MWLFSEANNSAVFPRRSFASTFAPFNISICKQYHKNQFNQTQKTLKYRPCTMNNVMETNKACDMLMCYRNPYSEYPKIISCVPAWYLTGTKGSFVDALYCDGFRDLQESCTGETVPLKRLHSWYCTAPNLWSLRQKCGSNISCCPRLCMPNELTCTVW